MLKEYDTGVGVQSASLPVDARWYYASMEDALSLPSNRIPDQTLFDAFTQIKNGATVSEMPREISLILDKPTEINFQKYFPADTITSVDIFRLPSSEWRKINNTTVAFQMQKEKKEILVRITTDGFIREYSTILVTKPPTLGIKNVTSDGLVSGELSESVTLPLGIQSFVGQKSWILDSSVSNQGTLFNTSLSRTNASFDIMYNNSSLGTFDRNTSLITPVV